MILNSLAEQPIPQEPEENRERVVRLLDELQLEYREIQHPPLPTAEAARVYWKGHEGSFCRNLFFRNHKGNQHYLVILENTITFNIRGLEKSLGQGKLTLASNWRLKKYLGVMPGSVSVFGIINDHQKHVKIFLDEPLRHTTHLGFHPNDNRYTMILPRESIEKFLQYQANEWDYLDLGIND